MNAQAQPDLQAVLSLLSEAVGEAAQVRAEGGDRIRLTLPSSEDLDLRVRSWSVGNQRTRGDRTLWLLRGVDRHTLNELRQRGESFVDLKGLVRLHLPGLLVDREGLQERTRTRSTGQTRSPFADASSLVSRVLFSGEESGEWTITSLARAAGVAISTASYAVRALAERDLVEVHREWRKKVVRLVDRRALVHEWTRSYNWRSNARVAFEAPLGSPSRFLRRLPQLVSGIQWALTLQAGASLVAPHARWDIIHLYLDSRSVRDALDLGSELGWRPAEKGPVVLLVPHYRSSVWFGLRKPRALPVVSDLQLILDLWHYPVRGREQAEHLLEGLERRSR